MKHHISKGRERLALLYSVVEPPVIRSFLLGNKKLLMMVRGAGFRLDNIPMDPHELIALVTKVPQSQHAKLLKTLRGAAPENLPEVADALETLQAAEGIDDGIDPKELRDCRWVVLLAWLSGEGPAEVSAFVDEADRRQQRAHKPISEDRAAEESASAATPQQISMEKDTASGAPVAVPQIPGSDPMSVDNAETETLSEIDEETDAVVVRWKDNHPNFAEVLGVRRKGRWYPLEDRTLRCKLFPLVGDVYVSTGRHAGRGDYSAWKVNRQESNGQHRTEYRAVSECASVFRVVVLDARSEETDRVREQVRQQGASASLQYTLFRLADGLTFKIRTGTNLGTTDFPEPAEAWTSLTPHQAGAVQIALTPLPKADTTYDLADINVLARRMLQQADTVEGLPKFSKAQLTELSRWIKEGEDAGSLGRRSAQIVARLSDLTRQQELVAEFTDRLQNHPAVRAELERRLRDKEDQLMQEKSKLVAEIESLRHQRDNVKRQVEADKVRASEAASRVTKSVRRAFDKAVTEGEEKLGESALFAALLGRTHTHSTTTAPAVSTETDAELEVETISRGREGSMGDALIDLGLPKRAARAFASVIEIGCAAGLIVAFRGGGASLFAEAVASHLSNRRGSLLRMRPGVLDPRVVVSAFEQSSELDAVCVLKANSSAMDAYGEHIESTVWRRVLNKAIPVAPAVVLSLIDGPVALPIGSGFRWVTLTVNLDLAVDDADEGLESESWGEQVTEAASKAGVLTPLGARVIQRIAATLPKDCDVDTLTQLKVALLSSVSELSKMRETTQKRPPGQKTGL